MEIRLTMEEAKKVHILEDFRKGYLKAKEAADMLGITREHIYWLKKKIEERGVYKPAKGAPRKPAKGTHPLF